MQISERYIRPAINKMETLATVSNSEWAVKSREFIVWCDDAVGSIDQLARTTSANMGRNVEQHIKSMEQRAIEANEATYE